MRARIHQGGTSDAETRTPLIQPRRGGRSKDQKTRLSLDGVVPKDEIVRARVFSKEQARLAKRTSETNAIRDRVLGGLTIDASEAFELLKQVGLRHYSSQWYSKHRIPILGHKSRYTDGVTGRLQQAPSKETKIRFRWGRKTFVLDYARIRRSRKQLIPGLQTEGQSIDFCEDSVLGEVHGAANRLADRYSWKPGDAWLFLLCGQVPTVEPIVVVNPESWSGFKPDHRHFRIELSVEPWVNPETVKQFFAYAQRYHTKRQVRLQDTALLELFDFVGEYLEREHGRTWIEIRADEQFRMKGFWKPIAEQWNETHPAAKFPQYDGRTLSQAYCRVHDNLMWATFVPHGVKFKRRR